MLNPMKIPLTSDEIPTISHYPKVRAHIGNGEPWRAIWTAEDVGCPRFPGPGW